MYLTAAVPKAFKLCRLGGGGRGDGSAYSDADLCACGRRSRKWDCMHALAHCLHGLVLNGLWTRVWGPLPYRTMLYTECILLVGSNACSHVNYLLLLQLQHTM